MNSTKSKNKESFLNFSLKSELIKSIKELGFNNPTPIQSKVIPHLMSSEQDLIASAQTGTGKTAAFAYQLLQQFKNKIRRVLLLGPAHRVWLTGAALPEADTFETPLGQITLDRELMENMLADYSWITISDQAHAEEHCLEVQLPFLQESLNDFKIVPLVVGDTDSELLAQMILKLTEDDQTLIVISTDLSHYHDYKTSCELDLRTAIAIESLTPELLSPEDACGAYPLRGALLAASKSTWQVHRLDLCNSGDTAGDRVRVVGYGAWMVTS